MKVVHLTDKNFKAEVLDSKLPVLVDFWASWCMPCKKLAPLVEEIAKEYQERIKVASLNIDDGQRTASQYGIMSIPTLMLFKEGKVVEQVVRVITKAQLKKRIEEHI